MKSKAKIATKSRVVFNPNRLDMYETDSKHVMIQGSMRDGLYAHYCYDWDEMLIDENDPEFECCNCGKPNPKT